jgi:hypothetical protein
MYFGKATRAIRKADLGYSFELSPPKAAVQLAEPKPNAHRAAKGDWLDVANLTDDREPHRSGTSERDCTGLTPKLISGGQSALIYRWILSAV